MDAKNLFETPTTYRLHRAEYGLALVVSAVLFFTHLGEVSWPVFIGLFLYIDLIGYIPGAIAFHRSTTKQISKVYYVLYNSMHSLVTAGLVALVWIWAFGAEWALLALPLHLCGDRALFGNFLKSFRLPFEPVADPGYLCFRTEFEGGGDRPRPVAAPVDARAS